MKLRIKQYTIIWISLIIAGLLIVSSVNYAIDPAHLFHAKIYEQGIANLILEGKNVAGVTNYDERLIQKMVVSNMPEKKDVIVLGSSRSMQIRSALFPGMSFYNNSVSGATIEDFLAIYSLYEQHGITPSIIVMGLDPWLLNANNNQSRWQTLGDEYRYIANKISAPLNVGKNVSNTREKLIQLVSLAYFKQSVSDALSKKTGKYFATADNESTGNEILADGSLVYDVNTRGLSVADVEASAISYAKADPVYSLGDFSQIDKNLLNTFTLFIDYLQSKNIRCIFYLPPYHPAAYAILSQSDRYKIITEVENTFRQIAEQKGITVLGSYDPGRAQSAPDDFFDGMHPKEISIARSFAELPPLIIKK